MGISSHDKPITYRALSPSSPEAGSSSDDSAANNFPKYPSFSRINMAGPTLRSPRAARFSFFLSGHDDDGAHHFLDSCHLCKKALGSGRDIFMYRGDTPFCSEECRQEQIEMDEAQEKRIKMAQKQQQKNSNSTASPSKSEKIHVRVSGTVVAG